MLEIPREEEAQDGRRKQFRIPQEFWRSSEGPIESPYFYLQTTAKVHLEEVFQFSHRILQSHGHKGSRHLYKN